jgi:hypothetical protein
MALLTQTTDTRTGISPIGTTSPNTGASANTNSTYAQGAFTTGLAVLDPSVTAYTVQNTDYQGTVIFDTASACAVTLNSAVTTNFTCQVMNLSTGAITLTPTSGYLVNGAASVTLQSGQGAIVGFANRAWTAFVGGAPIPVQPANTPKVTHEWLDSYSNTTGAFTQSQPGFADVSGQISTSQLPASGLSVTITTAALTPTGTQGSMTFTNGILTAQVQAT